MSPGLTKLPIGFNAYLAVLDEVQAADRPVVQAKVLAEAARPVAVACMDLQTPLSGQGATTKAAQACDCCYVPTEHARMPHHVK